MDGHVAHHEGFTVREQSIPLSALGGHDPGQVVDIAPQPLHAGHLRLLSLATEAGAIIMPPVPAFYARPASLAEMVDHTVGRVLDLFDIDSGLAHRWKEAPEG